ncbi:MAG: tRNA epoxyqueuosine(34) reductase QueG [Vicinamibacterales bacterium]|jgi:epoxyqueuosine reductase|nr:tRNA epoxyqueuosine(34) reductase QueG [Vicinamibacterales bacterium]
MLSSEAIKTRARELGFDLCGIAPPAAFRELGVLREWLDRGYAGEMGYMARTAERRADVRAVMPSARSVVVLGTLYNTDQPYSTEIDDPGEALISRYAWGDDYHSVLGERTEALRGWLVDRHADPVETRVYVDTGPVQERVYAQQAGLGWVGKNTCLINPVLGSWLFLSEILCSLPLESDTPGFDQCGTCTLCLDACPTGAFPEPGVLDSTQCLSYLTIETKGAIPPEQRAGIGSHVYGCDVCQDVCPYNDAAPISTDPAWQPRVPLDRPRLAELWARSDAALRAAIRNGPMTRARVKRLRRNLAVAMGNSGEIAAAEALGGASEIGRPDAESIAEPQVAEHVDWARRRLAARGESPSL